MVFTRFRLSGIFNKSKRNSMSSSILKNVVLVGASGSIGKVILDALVQAPQLHITVLTRSSSSHTFPANVTVRPSDFSEADLTAAFKGQDAVISAVGATAFAEQKKFVDASIAAGVKRFIPSEFSSNTLSPAVCELLPLFGQKLEILEYLKTKESSSFTWTAIWTALLFDWGLSNGFLEYDIAGKSATIWDGGNSKFTLTNAEQLGRSVIATLERPVQTANKNLYVASVETSQKEILEALEAASGSKFTVVNTTTKEQVAAAQEKLSKGDFSGAFALVRATSFATIPNLRANYVKDEQLSNDLLSLKFESVQETAARVVAAAAK
jgi:uncharacterized protein YbjT (DUF2867 family)